MDLNRRDLFAAAGWIGATAMLAQAGEGKELGTAAPYELPPLPYAYDALEPHIDKETMTLHHDKHHLAYVNGLNGALKKLEEARAAGKLDDVKHVSRDLAFHGSGHLLHCIFWNNMSPKGGAPEGLLKSALERDFGSVDAFKAHFSAAAKQVEASGWAILGFEPLSRRLLVMTAEKHQNLTAWGVTPLLALDVWEHAYYLKYRNNRGAYVDAFWNVANWADVGQRLEKALG
jgi:Fe-Mn family superoxide dismutase